jgi:PAS domain S-box-containing protein
MRLTRAVLMILPGLLSIPVAFASPSQPINVLVMHWYDRGYPSNDLFDRSLQTALEASAPQGVEYYSEYLETNRFPGDEQARLLSEYLRQKYAGRKLDVIISGVSRSLDFLLKYRSDLFPGVPIVFANDRPVRADVAAAAGAAGFTFGNTYAKTLNLALQWHPRTKQLFVVSGTLNRDKAWESIVRDDLRPYERRVAITYLTDLSPDELTVRVRTLPTDSLIFYVWQQVLDAQGGLLEAADVLARVVREAKVPIYGRSYAMVGRGIVGGYVWTQEGNAAKQAEILMRVVNGTPPKDIPIEIGPDIPMFDWRELKRWGIREDRLPLGSIVRFRELTFWQQYQRRIAGTVAVFLLQAILIGALLVQRKQAKRRAAALVEAQSVLQTSEERFRRVFEEGPLGLALVGRDYRFLKVNNALCQMVGYTEAELIQKSFAEITHPDDLQADVELAGQLFRREIPFYRIQKRYVKKTGEIIWINLTASIILGPNSEAVHGLAMVEDITEIRRSQEESLLRQKLESLGTLAGGIAHDFNNLLGAVHAQADLASVELDAGLSCREELSAIRNVAVRGSEIVRQLMIYAGAENAVVELLDLSKVVNEILSLLRVSVTKHAVIEANLDQDLPAIRANAAQLQQIVLNLITNASDAIGDRDGVIRVVTKRGALTGEPAASLSKKLADGDYVRLEVSDTGRGMSVQTQAKVFDPFFTTKSAGRGLGLAVVDGIVRSLGGAIHFTSELDKGTTFQILLPCAEATAARSGPGISAVGALAAASQHGTVLVVDDESQLRQAVVKMLSRTGFEVFEAADGTSAIELLRTDGGKIDLILLDLTIPGASSHEIVAEAVHAKPNIRVILTSAYSQETIAGAMSLPQVRSFIRKPFRFADLLNTLRTSLS